MPSSDALSTTITSKFGHSVRPYTLSRHCRFSARSLPVTTTIDARGKVARSAGRSRSTPSSHVWRGRPAARISYAFAGPTFEKGATSHPSRTSTQDGLSRDTWSRSFSEDTQTSRAARTSSSSSASISGRFVEKPARSSMQS